MQNQSTPTCRLFRHSSPRSLRLAFLAGVILSLIQLAPATSFGEAGDDNPTGVAGDYNGNITTGCSYDAYTDDAKRTIDDIVVPGTIGAYPLKWTRYWNSHTDYQDHFLGARWRFSYIQWAFDWARPTEYPDGRIYATNNPFGIEDTLVTPYVAGQGYPQVYMQLADGGKVVFNQKSSGSYGVAQIVDPYGQITTIVTTGTGVSQVTKITEPGGRYLQVNYNADGTVSQVGAYDGVNSQPIQTVSYHWISGTGGTSDPVIDTVTYSDGTTATYTYQDATFLGACVCPVSQRTNQHISVLATANDVRYVGPMRQIGYVYQPPAGQQSNETRILSENHLVNGQIGEAVSTINGGTETRGDGATRTLAYFVSARTIECPQCTGQENPDPMPTDGKLQSITDFMGHTMTLTYETDQGKADAGFITAVADPNGHTTSYERQTGSWGITTITHPDGSTIQQTFWQDLPYYLASRTDELGHTTTYTRDSSYRITRKDYPDGSWETFTYNSFGEVLAHEMTSGGTESFTYDSRGLKISYTDATNGTTTYSYYTSGPWIDRIETVTHPANASGFQATETFEYDRAFAGGLGTGSPIAGRGVVTKTTHTDGTFITNVYDTYGELRSTTDELGHTTTDTYDDYGRVLTTTDPLGHSTSYSYVPTGKTSSEITTSKTPFVTTLPSGKKTNFYYDANWRKTRVQVAPSTSDESNSYFNFDEGGAPNIGHLTSTTDPRNDKTTYGYDIRDRQISITDPLSHTTSFTFDVCGNKLTETHANGELIEYDQYDPMNRLLHKKVHRDASTVDQSSMTYDSAGNLHTQTDENGHVYSYAYDAMNRPAQMTYPNALFEKHIYDPAGNVASYTNRSGTIQTFTYDNRNRKLGFSWNDGVTSPQTEVYDAASRNTQIVNNDATINFTYDADNKALTQEEWETTPNLGDNVHRIVTYAYDVDGNRLSIQYPSGSLLNYGYTQRNQVSNITPAGQNALVSYTFDPSGNITGRTLDNGTSSAYTVDAVNRDSSVVHTLVGTTRRFDYGYNSVSDITIAQRDSGQGDGYTYDLTQQILGYAQNGTVNWTAGTVSSTTNTTLAFDGCGNRTTQNGVPFSTPNNMNQPTDAGISYDNNGNLIMWNSWNYTYDAQNRLREALNASAATDEHFYYDGLNRQVARTTSTSGGNPTPTPTPTPSATPTPTATPAPTPTPTPTATPTPTPTPTPPPGQCWPVTFSTTGGYPNTLKVTLSTVTTGATIFYTTDGTTPTHTAGTPTGTTHIYSTVVKVTAGNETFLEALAYERGMTDSVVTSFDANNTGHAQISNASMARIAANVNRVWQAQISNAPKAAIAANDKRAGKARISGASMAKMAANIKGVWQAQLSDASMATMQQQQTITEPTTVFSVWDGDWALVEEYDGSGNLFESYVQGYHGLVKTLVSNIYYYQDELGSTSHIADSTGHLLEAYRYNLYGAPTYWDPSGNPLPQGSNYDVRDLFTGQRWISEIGLYDDRNRFMSPDLGRFLQPDPIGFKGDASNLYRYCGNDWANKSDPMGLTDIEGAEELIRLAAQASVNSVKSYRADLARGVPRYERVGRSQDIIQEVDAKGHLTAPKLQTNRDGTPKIIKATMEHSERSASSGQKYHWWEKEGATSLSPGQENPARGHMHDDKTGNGVKGFSPVDQAAAKAGGVIGLINESEIDKNGRVTAHVLVPQQEGGTPRTANVKVSTTSNSSQQSYTAPQSANIEPSNLSGLGGLISDALAGVGAGGGLGAASGPR